MTGSDDAIELPSGRWRWRGLPSTCGPGGQLLLEDVDEPANRMSAPLPLSGPPLDAAALRELAARADSREWRWADGIWRARVDRLRMSCGACPSGRYLHITTPEGERFTYPFAVGARLGEVRHQELVRLVRG
ncbi:MAG TPA: hypothetical protein VMK65_06785 [Longimicrobiales bacterium]|nr:hypothetical protein [Longimicrobiales bacterium]